MPETLPNSNFNDKNECYWCQTNFPNYKPKGDKALSEFLSKHKRDNSKVDCLVGFSGGKDSAYTLYKLKEQFGMRVEAFTYVHEGSTPFSIENAKKICKHLGIKHHIVSLKDMAHLKAFKSFFSAWVSSPSTIAAGMTCVACKHLHLLGLEIAKERNIPIIVWSTSPLEYSPFLAVKYKPSSENQFKRSGFIESSLLLMKESIISPKFAQGILSNFKTSYQGALSMSPTSSYLKKKYPSVTPLMFYNFHIWNPNTIYETIEKNTKWSSPKEIKDDWHSDCIFNYYKEYMFQKMLGVTYTDAYLSNQIRYNHITRKEAIKKLIRSKKDLSSKLKYAIKEINLEKFEKEIDYECFNIEVI
jgi:predicted subunit of tRNA(5-methylaminomethyl-2-thiouridylate) methyltransferase